MIERERESYQPLLHTVSPPTSPDKQRKKKIPPPPAPAAPPSYGTLAGEALLHGDDSGSFEPLNGRRPNGSSTAGPQDYAEYQQPLQKLPPPIPARRRAESSGERSTGSTVSGASGHNRLQRASSEGQDAFGRDGALSPTYAAGGYPRAPSRPPRSEGPGGLGAPVPGGGHPLRGHRRRDSSDSFSSRGHRRGGSHGSYGELRRGGSSGSLFSLPSQGGVPPEGVALLPDPRWGGGRSRSFSGGSREAPRDVDVPHQTGGGYGAVGSGKEVIAIGVAEPPRGHRRNVSEVSAASAASIDRSLEPAVTDMSKSALFGGTTERGVLRLQLPKDNFRLLSDRDLESGAVYKRALVDNEDEYFQEYHIEDADRVPAAPFLELSADARCGGTKPLPPSHYVMAVDGDIYRRMLDEVAESMTMPCKLFYCGHHEDVDYPSIGIAAAGVAVVFLVMLWATFAVDG